MKKTVRFAAAAVLLLCGAALFAKEYKVYKLARTPVIDGRLDDHSWSRIPAGRGFRTLKKNNPYAQERFTSFKMGYKGDYLYVAALCDEPDLKSIKAVATYRDGWTFDDAIEMFFLPAGKKNYMQLMVNARGALWTKLKSDNKHPEPPEDLKIAAGRTKNAWTIEMKIPLRFLRASTVEKMRFNVGRNVPGRPTEKVSCWADVIGSYAETANFAVMRKSPYNGPADLEEAENALNRRYDASLYLKILQIARKGKIYKNLESRYGASPEFAAVVKMQQQIARTYRNTPKSAYADLLRQWENCVAVSSVPRKKMVLSVKNPASDLKFFVNGKAVQAKNGKYSFVIEEGVTTLCVTGSAKGNTPVPRFDFAGNPELNNRWAYASSAPQNWMKIKFDDRKWKTPPQKLPAGKFFLRQVLIFNRKHDGRLRCLNPSIHSWGFSKDSVETLYLSLYSPTGLHVNSFDFIMDLPRGFQLLDMAEGARRNRLSLAPVKVRSVPVKRNGKNYTRYTLTYNKKDIHEWTTADSILGIFKDKSGKTGAKDAIYYARRINGNVTELTGKLPVHILPPVNGRVLKKMFMSYYMGSMPQGLSEELTAAVIRSSVQAGVDRFMVYPVKSRKNDIIMQNKGKLVMGFLNHPIWGAKLAKGHVVKLLDNNKDLYATFYTGKRILKQKPRTPAHKLIYQFCPSLTVTKYKDAFFKAVQADYREFFFKAYPKSEYMFLNWEQEPWCNTIYRRSQDPRNAYCFCTRCKKDFRAFAKIPQNKVLSNETIFKDYYEQWRLFRYSLDAKVHAIVEKAARSLGKKIFFYSWSNHFGYWEAAKNVPYRIFLGCPGNGTADRRQQLSMDSYMKFHMGKLGRRNIAGQRFVFFPQTYGWNTTKTEGHLKFNVMSDDGYIHPETWKWQTIRILASQQGGLDYQNPLEMVGGIKYYVGEATRMIAEYEDIFYDGKRQDSLAKSKQIAYPDLLVLVHGKKRLVLAFNEGTKPKTVTVQNLRLDRNAKAKAYYANRTFADAKNVTFTIKPNDVEVIYIQE